MKVRMKLRVSGYYSEDGGDLKAWPEPGEMVDLPDAAAKAMLEAGTVVKPSEKVETRPTQVKGEKRTAKKA